MKSLISFLFVLILSCNSSNKTTKEDLSDRGKLDSINSWYKTLVAEQYSLAYIFQTEVYNKDPLLRYGNIFRYETIEYGKYQILEELSEESEDGYAISTNEIDFNANKNEFVRLNFERALSYLNDRNLEYSKLILQIPHATGKTSHDVSKLKAVKDIAATKLLNDYFVFDNSIASLVDSKRYDSNFNLTQLPQSLVSHIYKTFENTKKYLPNEFRNKINNSKFYIAPPNDTSFSISKLYLVNKNKDVIISPILIRAILVQAVTNGARRILDYANTGYNYDFPVQILELQKLSSKPYTPYGNPYEVKENNSEHFAWKKRQEVLNAYSSIMKSISSTLEFLILHEFSHIYLGPNEIDEFRCDCYAFKSLKKKNKKIDLGIFEHLMVSAIQNKYGSYWKKTEDSTELSQIIKRFERINKIDSLIESKSMTIDFNCDTLKTHWY